MDIYIYIYEYEKSEFCVFCSFIQCFLFFYPEVAGCCWRAAKHHGRCLSSIQASYWPARTTTCKFNKIRNQTAVAWHPVAKQGNCREKEECWGEGSYVKYFTCAVFFQSSFPPYENLLSSHWVQRDTFSNSNCYIYSVTFLWMCRRI